MFRSTITRSSNFVPGLGRLTSRFAPAFLREWILQDQVSDLAGRDLGWVLRIPASSQGRDPGGVTHLPSVASTCQSQTALGPNNNHPRTFGGQPAKHTPLGSGYIRSLSFASSNLAGPFESLSFGPS